MEFQMLFQSHPAKENTEAEFILQLPPSFGQRFAQWGLNYLALLGYGAPVWALSSASVTSERHAGGGGEAGAGNGPK